jgi:hypothetical protein
MGGFLGPTDSLAFLENRKNFCPCQDSNQEKSSPQPHHYMNYINSTPAALLNFTNCSFDPYRIWVRDPWFKLTQHSKNYENGADENWI